MQTEEFRYHRTESRFSPLSQPIIQSALRIESVQALRTWIQTEVNAVIPHRSALLLLGRCTPLGVTIINRLAVNIPPTFLQAIEDEHGQIHCPYLARWHATSESQLISGSRVDFLTYSKWKTAFFANELQPGLLDVSIDNSSNTRLFFYLFGVRVPCAEAMKLAASVVTPFAHDAWLALNASGNQRNLGMECNEVGSALTKAESEVLVLVRQGKRNKEIAKLLGKSDLTVKKQVQNILRKFGGDSRMSLIARPASVFGISAEDHRTSTTSNPAVLS